MLFALKLAALSVLVLAGLLGGIFGVTAPLWYRGPE